LGDTKSMAPKMSHSANNFYPFSKMLPFKEKII